MAVVRSPQYPVVGLKEALEKVRMIWEKDYTSELPRSVIGEHMGYSGINGKSLSMLATLSKYGLLEGRGDQTRVSNLAVEILVHPIGSDERSSAVLDASTKPALFQSIQQKFDGRSPSNQALKSHLLTQGFTLLGVNAAIKSFRETEEFVNNEITQTNQLAQIEVVTVIPQNLEEVSQIPEVVPNLTSVVPIASSVPTVSMTDRGLEISGGVISSLEQFEKMMRRLSAGRLLLDDDPE